MRMPKLEPKKGEESTQLLGPFQLWARNWMSKGMCTLHGLVPCKLVGRLRERERERVLINTSGARMWAYGGSCCREVDTSKSSIRSIRPGVASQPRIRLMMGKDEFEIRVGILGEEVYIRFEL